MFSTMQLRLAVVVLSSFFMLAGPSKAQQLQSEYVAAATEDCQKKYPEWADRTVCLQRIIADLDRRLVALNANFENFKIEAFEKLKSDLANFKNEMSGTLKSYIKSESPIRIEIVGGWCIAWHQENLPIMGRDCNDPRARAAKIFLR